MDEEQEGRKKSLSSLINALDARVRAISFALARKFYRDPSAAVACSKVRKFVFHLLHFCFEVTFFFFLNSLVPSF